MTRLWLSDKAAKQMRAGDPKVIAGEAEQKRERERREAEKRVEREAKEKEKAKEREQNKAQRREAADADKTLATALGEYEVTARAINPKERDKAYQAAADASMKVQAVKDALKAAQQKLIDAEAAFEERKAERDHLDSLANEKLPAAKDKLRGVWDENEKAWHKMPSAYRKEHRDRQVKNKVKAVLGLKGGED